MRRIALFTLAALCGITAFGQGLLDCVEPDVLRALLPQGQGQDPPAITGEVPRELVVLKMPGAFAWIGSAERIAGRVSATMNLTLVSAAWRSSLEPEAARAAAAAALTSSGWDVRPPPVMGVFTSASMPVMQTACREGMPVNLNTSAMDGVTYVLVTFQRGSTTGNAICDRPAAAFQTIAGLQSQLPQLEMPVDPERQTSARLQGTSMNVSGNMIHAQAEFVIRGPVGNVARHFATQMADQGWTRDAQWSGASTAGSSWSKRPQAGSLMQGTLSVTRLDERQLVAVLRVSTLQ